MLDKQDSAGCVQHLESKKKSTSNRCNLKKLLDPTRFSPRSLRLSRLVKISDSATADEHIRTYKMPQCPEDSSLLIKTEPSKNLGCLHSKMLYTTPDVKTSEGIVEEEYEESLSAFADLTLEGSKPKKFDSTLNPLVQSLYHNCSVLRESASPRLSKSPASLQTPMSFATEDNSSASDSTPADLGTNRFYQSEPCDQSIYNEPCDAKSVTYTDSTETSVIYTSPGFNCSSYGTPFASHSNAVNCSLASSLSSSATDSAIILDKPQPTDMHNPANSAPLIDPNSTPQPTTDPEPITVDINGKSCVKRYQDSSNGGHLQPNCQLNPGFVDAPRGNSVIVHHSTSAFARVPPSVSPDQTTGVSTTHVQATRSTPHPIGRPQPLGVTGSRGPVDAHATYEEAWDLKMTRQLGFGIPRLPLPPARIAVDPHTSTGLVSPQLAAIPRAELLDRPIPNDRISLPEDQRLLRGTSVRSSLRYPASSASDAPVSNSLQSSNPTKNGLVCQESSELFDRKPAGIPRQRDKKIEPSDSPVEYDYAYNGSWSLGVQLNMKLAINENNGACPTPLCTTKPSSGLPRATQATTLCYPNQWGQKRSSSTNPRLATGLSFDLDNLSADSFADSWDTRHHKIISDLTRSRFVDASSVLPTTGVSSAQAAPLSTPLHLRPLPEPTDQPTVSNDVSMMPNKNPPRPACKPSQLSPRSEALPLEDQPWFHPSLTRSEAEELLATEPEGTFLVRNSETCLNDYSLTIKHKIFVHMKISRNAAGQYILGDYSQPYASVPQMIHHYARTLVPVRGADYVTLKHPFCR